MNILSNNVLPAYGMTDFDTDAKLNSASYKSDDLIIWLSSKLK